MIERDLELYDERRRTAPYGVSQGCGRRAASTSETERGWRPQNIAGEWFVKLSLRQGQYRTVSSSSK